MREQNLQGLLCHVAPASCDVMTINKGFLSELIASVGTYNMLLGALLDVGDSKAMEQFVVSSCTIRFFCKHCWALNVSVKFCVHCCLFVTLILCVFQLLVREMSSEPGVQPNISELLYMYIPD